MQRNGIFIILVLFLSCFLGCEKKPKFQIIPKTINQTKILVSNIIPVLPQRINAFDFSTKSQWSNIKVSGNFMAQGGSGNDIRVYIMPRMEYINYVNGHPAKSLFDSGQITTSKVNLDLPSQDEEYTIIFDNLFSTYSQKTVNAKFILTYDTLTVDSVEVR